MGTTVLAHADTGEDLTQLKGLHFNKDVSFKKNFIQEGNTRRMRDGILTDIRGSFMGFPFGLSKTKPKCAIEISDWDALEALGSPGDDHFHADKTYPVVSSNSVATSWLFGLKQSSPVSPNYLFCTANDMLSEPARNITIDDIREAFGKVISLEF